MEKVYMPALSHIKKKLPDITSVHIQRLTNKKVNMFFNTRKELSEKETCRYGFYIRGCLDKDHISALYCNVSINASEYSKENCVELIIGNDLYSLEGMNAIKKYLHGERIMPIAHESLFDLDWDTHKEGE